MSQPNEPTALTDEENVGWVLEPGQDSGPVSLEDAYWRMRGMVPPPRTEPVE